MGGFVATYGIQRQVGRLNTFMEARHTSLCMCHARRGLSCMFAVDPSVCDRTQPPFFLSFFPMVGTATVSMCKGRRTPCLG